LAASPAGRLLFGVVEVVIGAFSLAVVTAVTIMALVGNESKQIQTENRGRNCDGA
jgi:hypothetical protein